MTILLTGAPGWLGNRFLELLTKDKAALRGLVTDTDIAKIQKIRCLVLPTADTSPIEKTSSDIEVVRGDVSDIASLRSFFADSEGAVLFHLAGVIHPSRGVKEFYSVNVHGTHNILEMARRSNVKKIVFMSSNSPIGCNPDTEHRFTEESPYNPYMNYGRSKMKAEMAVKKFAELYDMDTTILRACWFYGPHQPARQTKFFSLIKDGKFPIVGDGFNLRSMSYVDDICQGMLLAAFHPIAKGKTYWIADERPYSMKEIVSTVGEVLEQEFGFEVRAPRVRLPNFVGGMAYLADFALQTIGFYNQEIHVASELNKNIACSVERAKRELGYTPSVSLREGMKKSVEWCLKNGYEL